MRFQAQVGVHFALGIVAERAMEATFSLGLAMPIWIRFESEAPVDDILVATSEGGFVAIQAKTTASLSSKPDSPLVRTIHQFVRHWLVCRDGTGAQGWDRRLQPDRDRLVLAVGPTASAAVRHDLPEALALHIQAGSARLTQNQAKALDLFKVCAEQAWNESTTDPWDPGLVAELARLVVVWTFDPDRADGQFMEVVAQTMVAPGQSQTLVVALFNLCDRWMSERGGGDLPRLRSGLMQAGVVLRARPRFDRDITRLKKHSQEIADSLRRYESIEATWGQVRVTRECQAVVCAAAEAQSLLLIGEPGAGKSAVINTLARELRAKGDVVELAVDRYQVDDLDGLRVELELEHSLVKVLEAWDGPTAGWLIIDALDATRGGGGEGAFRALIERVLALKGRWKVVASIRTFDLRMGVRFRELFSGEPPDAGYRDPAFRGVRHLLVPPWSAQEFEQVLEQAPTLRSAMAAAPHKLRRLAEVPFNTRLMCELLDAGLVAESLRKLDSQVQLMRLYWDHRIVSLGAAAETCLRPIVEIMVEKRSLRASVIDAGASDPAAFDALCQRGILVRVEGDRYVQFRHHLLFDYVASRVLLDPDAIVAGHSRFPKAEAKGLLLAPALGLLLQELWTDTQDRGRFWTAAARILSDQEGDPVLRSATGRLCAELPQRAGDIQTLANHLSVGDARALTAIGHVVAALAVRLEDGGDKLYEPWVALAGAMAERADRVPNELGVLTHLLVDVAKPPQLLPEVGKAARALLLDAFHRNEPGKRVASVIPLVIATISTGPTETKALIRRIFEPARFDSHGWEDVPALCRDIDRLSAAAPAFAADVYHWTYSAHPESDVETRMGESRILSLTSTARQDFDMALYSLSEFFPEFLKRQPVYATDALIRSVEAYIERAHALRSTDELESSAVPLGDQEFHIREDLSHVWAHNPDSDYGHDGDVLMAKFVKAFVALPEAEALQVAHTMMGRIESAVFWARLFLVAVRRRDALVDLLWPIAASDPCLRIADTRKDAVDLIAAGYATRDPEEKSALERRVLQFDMSSHGDPEWAKRVLVGKVFTAIGVDHLISLEARAQVEGIAADDVDRNERPFRIESGWTPRGPFDWIDGLDPSVASNAAMMSAIEAANAFISEPGQLSKSHIEASTVLAALDAVADGLRATDLDPGLRRYGEGVIGKACVGLANGERLVARPGAPDLAERFLPLLQIAIDSDNPVVEDDTEIRFERSPGWGSPAPRVEAAAAVLDLCLPRPDLHERLRGDIDRLLADQHPAVRLQAISHLLRIWDVDRQAFWTRLQARLQEESNFGVMDHLVGVLQRVVAADPARTESLMFDAIGRFDGTEHHARFLDLVAGIVARFAVVHATELSRSTVASWIENPAGHAAPLRHAVRSLRPYVGLGLRPGEPDGKDIRQRAQRVLHRVVESCNQVLDQYQPPVEPSAEQLAAFRACLELVDTVGMELYFVTGKAGGEDRPMSDEGYATYLTEIAEILARIGDRAAPHTIYHLMQLIEVLAPYGAARAFDLTVHAIRKGGVQSGYQFESMGADLMVRLVGAFLADRKEIFEDEVRRQALVDCLEIFMEAGWTAARRLLYRLPELIQ